MLINESLRKLISKHNDKFLNIMEACLLSTNCEPEAVKNINYKNKKL